MKSSEGKVSEAKVSAVCGLRGFGIKNIFMTNNMLECASSSEHGFCAEEGITASSPLYENFFIDMPTIVISP